MTGRELFTPQEAAERDERLDRWLTDFFALNEHHMAELQYLLDKSWMREVGKIAFSLVRDKTTLPVAHLNPPMEKQINSIRVKSSSVKKWTHLAPIIIRAGLDPIVDSTIEDEDHIHDLVRSWFVRWQEDYPLKVARLKQSNDELSTPVLTLDTVTYLRDRPLEKPKSLNEAQHLIRLVTGGEVTTVNSWVLLLQASSGATIELLNLQKIQYTLLPMSAKAIREHVENNPNVLFVPTGLDLSTAPDRKRFIDISEPVVFSGINHLRQEGELRLLGSDLHSNVFDSYFAGVPTHAIASLLPWVNDIYLHGDPFYEET